VTARNFDYEHRIDMYQARCTNCGYVETDYGDYSGFGDVQMCIETLEDSWHARYRYEPTPRPDNPNAKIAHVEELLCPSCQTCEVCGASDARDVNDDEHLVCADHEDHNFAPSTEA
jgi:hypothetical protein